MSEPTTVTYSIAEVLKRIEDKLDRMDEKFEAKLDRMDEKFEAKLDTLQKEVNQKIDKLEQKLDKQSEEITTIKATLQAQQPLIQKIPDLAEKVSQRGLGGFPQERLAVGELKNWRQIVIIAVTAIISASITWVIRGGTFKP